MRPKTRTQTSVAAMIIPQPSMLTRWASGPLGSRMWWLPLHPVSPAAVTADRRSEAEVRTIDRGRVGAGRRRFGPLSDSGGSVSAIIGPFPTNRRPNERCEPRSTAGFRPLRVTGRSVGREPA